MAILVLLYQGVTMPILEMDCVVCGKKYRGGIFPSRTTKFCSKICFSESIKVSRLKRNCLTCGNIFETYHEKRIHRFCSPKCIRYTGPKEKLSTVKGKGFWQNATEEQKLERIKSEYARLVVKNDGCWEWSKKLHTNGYTTIHTGKNIYVLG